MKFLCVECDRPMALTETRGPDRGSMTVLFECPSCGRRTAMLTNAMETQMVASLGVKIGPGATAEAAPMHSLRTNLVGYPSGTTGEEPVGDTGAEAGNGTEVPALAKCPFTGAVREAIEAGDGPVWTDGARARMERIPSFVRPMVERGIEDVARRDGLRVIDEDVIARVRSEFGM